MAEITGLTGLFFGSFNPIHVGHMVMANYFAAFTPMKEVWFVVSPHNPLKDSLTLAPEIDRLEMVRIALHDDPRFRVTDIEFRMPKPSYTIDTLTRLKEKYPARDFALIVGGDNLMAFHRWKNPEEILRQYQVYVYARPGFNGGEFAMHPHITLLYPPQMAISASLIREGIRKGINLDHMMPRGVGEYIDKNNLFR
ncbi:MAG: nicotinic acid mononucleotide adenylyltransferase [Bacteroidetes bacterium HGW-Bacteroidetes-22]|nr:MAG: nicotinic acid mononucleotide adenylyltransferase [Bacteroidetes bacterium HGW-Bacteroidetes-22]